MAGEWLTPDQRAERRGDIVVEQYQAAEEDRAEEHARYLDAKYYNYSDAWYGSEPR